ncbi:MAG: sugar transferase [Candidatus Doudnabacteria bacterium]|nr:sugar transferase [Candidatus Doudnabacteria bacterium]
MKRSELLFNTLAIPMDAAMLLLAGVASFYLRINGTEFVGPVIFNLKLEDFLKVITQFLPFLLLIFAILGLYNLRGVRKLWWEFGRILVGVSLCLLLVVILFFFDTTLFPSRFIILATWGLGIFFTFFGRVLLRFAQTILFRRGIGLHKLVVIKGDAKETLVLEQVYRNKSHGYKVVAELGFSKDAINMLESLYQNGEIDEILQADSALGEEVNLQLVQFARNKGLQFSFVPNLFEVQRNQVELFSLQGVPVIALKNTPLDGWGRVIKRLADITASLICLLLTGPLFILISLAIKLDSRGKVIYSAPRGGRGKDFKFYKFRTMYQHLSVGEAYGGEEAEKVRQQLWEKNDRGGKDGPFLKIKHDPRVTRVGRFLRRTKLDEIPQFWNVLKGDMSMVGPRAHVLDEVERYRNRYRRMFSIKPGIFGMSQIAQVSFPDLPFEEEIKLNTYYIENWSLWLDVKVLAKSFWILFFAKKVNEDY